MMDVRPELSHLEYFPQSPLISLTPNLADLQTVILTPEEIHDIEQEEGPTEAIIRRACRHRLLSAGEEFVAGAKIAFANRVNSPPTTTDLAIINKNELVEWNSEKSKQFLDDAREAGQQARDLLFTCNQKFILDKIKKYTGKGVPLFDLFQEGRLGLLKAIDKYDWTRGLRFSTPTGWWVGQAAQKVVADEGREIRLPVHIVEIYSQVRNLQTEFEDLIRSEKEEGKISAQLAMQLLEKENMAKAIAEEMTRRRDARAKIDGKERKKIKPRLVLLALNAPSAEQGLTITTHEGEEIDLLSSLVIADEVDTFKETSTKMLQGAVLAAVQGIKKQRDRKIVAMRYGLGKYEQEHSPREIGEKLDMSPNAVGQRLRLIYLELSRSKENNLKSWLTND